MKKPSKLEQRILDVMLRELRAAMKDRKQLTLILDPYYDRSGMRVGCYPNTAGRTYDLAAEKRSNAKT